MFLMKDIIFFVKFGLKKLTIYTIILLSNLVPPPPSCFYQSYEWRLYMLNKLFYHEET